MSEISGGGMHCGSRYTRLKSSWWQLELQEKIFSVYVILGKVNTYIIYLSHSLKKNEKN